MQYVTFWPEMGPWSRTYPTSLKNEYAPMFEFVFFLLIYFKFDCFRLRLPAHRCCSCSLTPEMELSVRPSPKCFLFLFWMCVLFWVILRYRMITHWPKPIDLSLTCTQIKHKNILILVLSENNKWKLLKVVVLNQDEKLFWIRHIFSTFFNCIFFNCLLYGNK